MVIVGLDGAITGRIAVTLYSIDEHTERKDLASYMSKAVLFYQPFSRQLWAGLSRTTLATGVVVCGRPRQVFRATRFETRKARHRYRASSFAYLLRALSFDFAQSAAASFALLPYMRSGILDERRKLAYQWATFATAPNICSKSYAS